MKRITISKNGIVQVDEAYLRKCIESYGLDPDEELSKVRPYIWKGEIMEAKQNDLQK